MARNKINDLRNLLFEQIEKMMDPDCDLASEKEKAFMSAVQAPQDQGLQPVEDQGSGRAGTG